MPGSVNHNVLNSADNNRRHTTRSFPQPDMVAFQPFTELRAFFTTTQEDERPIRIIMFNIIAYWPCVVGEKIHFISERKHKTGLFFDVFFSFPCTQEYAAPFAGPIISLVIIYFSSKAHLHLFWILTRSLTFQGRCNFVPQRSILPVTPLYNWSGSVCLSHVRPLQVHIVCKKVFIAGQSEGLLCFYRVSSLLVVWGWDNILDVY